MGKLNRRFGAQKTTKMAGSRVTLKMVLQSHPDYTLKVILVILIIQVLRSIARNLPRCLLKCMEIHVTCFNYASRMEHLGMVNVGGQCWW